MAHDPGSNEDAILFEIRLAPGNEGDEESTYRTQNDQSRPHQRTNIFERKGSVEIRCTAVDVIHGSLKPGGDPATLLVFDFRFDPRKRTRRIIGLHMNFTFRSADSAVAADPEVLKIAPLGRMTLVPTKQQKTIVYSGETKGGGISLGLPLGLPLGASAKWEKISSYETSDATTVVGSIDLVGRNFGASNGASWTLMENKSVETGVPAFMRAAVLLRRVDVEAEFHAAFKIHGQVDLWTSLEKVFGRIPKDDPILYDPSLPPTNKLSKYDFNNLDSINLNDLSTIAFTNNI